MPEKPEKKTTDTTKREVLRLIGKRQSRGRQKKIPWPGISFLSLPV